MENCKLQKFQVLDGGRKIYRQKIRNALYLNKIQTDPDV